MATTFSKSQKLCGTCSNWLGPRKSTAGGFVTVESVSAGCSIALSKTQKFSFQQGICTARPGKHLWELWGPLKY
ncbi:MAG TPA: hypothetical protein DDW17_07740 [Deltaproteobacteria bacterium]|nr:hypothetical protein [Deltaproteobacteria bacterium]